jgi:hypothetical protein
MLDVLEFHEHGDLLFVSARGPLPDRRRFSSCMQRTKIARRVFVRYVIGAQISAFLGIQHEERGVVFDLGDVATAIHEGKVTPRSGGEPKADLVICGVGVRPALELAETAPRPRSRRRGRRICGVQRSWDIRGEDVAVAKAFFRRAFKNRSRLPSVITLDAY